MKLNEQATLELTASVWVCINGVAFIRFKPER